MLRPGTPLSLEDALVEGYVDGHNNIRLNSATGYIRPKDMLADRQQEIYAQRDRKLKLPAMNGRVAGSKRREERSGEALQRSTGGGADTFRMADKPSPILTRALERLR
jgi:hypothetical protein